MVMRSVCGPIYVRFAVPEQYLPAVRKAFDISSNAWLELQWYLYGTVFFLAASYTLLNNEHVRIDILANKLSKLLCY